MKRTTYDLCIAAVLVLALALALGAPADAHAADPPCPSGLPKVGHLGFDEIECDCTFSMDLGSGTRAWRFRAEPLVRGVESDGPGASVLKDGDVITAIDGLLITTAAGGRRFANVRPGEAVTLSVRRDGRNQQLRLVPTSVCVDQSLGAIAPLAMRGMGSPNMLEPGPVGTMRWSTESTPSDWMTAPPTPATAPTPAAAPTPAIPRTPATPPTPRAPRAPVAVIAPGAAAAPDYISRLMPVPRVEETLPRGWMGLALNCRQCGGELSDGDSAPVWNFTSPPQIYYVDPGSPAARAGLRRGDVLTHIDGVSLLTDDGGRRFGAVRPGQRVRWTYQRSGVAGTLAVTAEARPEERAVPLNELLDRVRDMRARGDLERLNGDARQLERDLRNLSDLQNLTPMPNKRLRYAGSVGGSEVEVQGLGNVVVDDSGDEIVITTRDATIRIKPTAKSATRRASGTPAPKK